MTAPVKAIFETLKGEAALTALLGSAKIYDHAPANVSFPYITFGRTSIYDWSTGTEIGTEQLFTLHVWSKAKGKKETLDIMEIAKEHLPRVAALLNDPRVGPATKAFLESRQYTYSPSYAPVSRTPETPPPAARGPSATSDRVPGSSTALTIIPRSSWGGAAAKVDVLESMPHARNGKITSITVHHTGATRVDANNEVARLRSAQQDVLPLPAAAA